MKVLCVIRVSTLEQEMESQKKEMEDFLMSEGFDSSDIVWLCRDGASARSLNKKYLDMLNEIKEKCQEIKTVAIWHFNRLGRVESKLIEMKEFFIQNNVQLLVKNPRFKLFENGVVNPAADMMFSIFAITVKFDTEEMMAKLKRGKDESRRKGKYTGGVVPFGFRVDDNNFIVIDEEKAPIIKHLYEMYIEGESLLHIMHYFRSFGYTMTVQNLKCMLRRPMYKQIIGEQMFSDFINEKISKNKDFNSKKRQYSLCEGLIICPKCGRHFYKHGTSYRCVSNQNVLRGTNDFCDSKISLLLARMDYVAYKSVYHVYKQYLLQNGSQRLEEVLRLTTELPKQINAIESKLEAFSDLLERYADNYAEGLWSKNKRDKKIEQANKDKVKLVNELTVLRTRLTNIEDEKSMLESQQRLAWMPKESMNKMTHLEIYQLVHKLIDHIELKETGRLQREITVYSKYFDIVEHWKVSGCGNGYKMYYLIPENQTWTDVTSYGKYIKKDSE